LQEVEQCENGSLVLRTDSIKEQQKCDKFIGAPSGTTENLQAKQIAKIVGDIPEHREGYHAQNSNK
jgi:hypothetical protein